MPALAKSENAMKSHDYLAFNADTFISTMQCQIYVVNLNTTWFQTYFKTAVLPTHVTVF